MSPRFPRKGGIFVGSLLALAAAVSVKLARRMPRRPAATPPQRPRVAAPPPPPPALSDEFWGGFASGYEGPDRRMADRGNPGGGERRAS